MAESEVIDVTARTSSELAPMIAADTGTAEEQDDLFDRYIGQYIINSELLKRSTMTSVLHYSLKIVAVILGAVAGLPFIKTSSLAGDEISTLTGGVLGFLGYLFTGGVLIGYGLTSIWVMNEITNFFNTMSEQENKLNEGRSPGYLKGGTVLLLSILSTIPASYVTLKYNKDNYVYLGIVILITAAYRIKGFEIFIDAVTNALRKRIHHVGYSTDKLDHFFNSLQQHLRGVDSIDVATTGAVDEGATKSSTQVLLEFFSRIRCEFIKPESSRLKKSVILGVTFFNATTVYAINSLFASRILGQIFGSNIAGGVCAPFVTLPSYCLDLFATREMVGMIYDFFLGAAPKNVVAQRHNKMTRASYSAAFTLAALSTAGDLFVAYDNLSEILPLPLVGILVFTMFATGTLFGTFAMSDIFMNQVLFFEKRHDENIANTERLSDLFLRLRQMLVITDDVKLFSPSRQILIAFFKEPDREAEPLVASDDTRPLLQG